MIAAIVLSLVSLVADVVGLAIPYWLYYSVGDSKTYSGLWKACDDIHGNTKCNSIKNTFGFSEIPVSLKVTQAMDLLGAILIAIAVVCALLQRCRMPNQTKLYKLAAFLSILAGLAMVVGCIVYATKFRKNAVVHAATKDAKFHAGFSLCASGGGLAIIAGIFFIVTGRRANVYSEI